MDRQIEINGLILSAGKSTRMGSFKPLIEFNGRTFIENVIAKISTVCKKIVIVTGHNSLHLEESIKNSLIFSKCDIQFIVNENYSEGMFSSLKRGVGEISKSEFILFHQVDQPNLPGEFYNDLKQKINVNYDWIQPVYNGAKGHPIIFGRNVIDRINDASADKNLRSISYDPALIKYYWDCNYKEVLTDLDTPEDIVKIKMDDK